MNEVTRRKYVVVGLPLNYSRGDIKFLFLALSLGTQSPKEKFDVSAGGIVRLKTLLGLESWERKKKVHQLDLNRELSGCKSCF